MASAGKGNYPITTAWSAWRPGAFPGPSAAQWNAWLPKPKGKGKGKGKGKDGKGGKGDKKGKGKQLGPADGPGSKSNFAMELDGGDKLFLAGRVYDIAGAAKKHGVDKKAKCWPVLLSTKKGGDALELCPNHASHGGMGTKYHTAPKGFDRGAIVKEFSEIATKEQATSAGWNHKVKKP